MSATEVHDILTLGLPNDHGHGIGLNRGYGMKTWRNGSMRITEVDIRQGVLAVFWVDLVTEQARVFIDARLEIVDGQLIVSGGGEIAPAEWN